MTSYTDLTYEVNTRVARIVLERPDRLNALRAETYEELIAALHEADGDTGVQVVVITGRGDRAFSAGGDLEMATTLLAQEGAAREHFFRRMISLSDLMVRLDKPVICAVNGLCVGGGAELVLFADFVIASEDAYFKFNGTEIGGCSWWGAPQLLPVMVGLRRAEEMLYLSTKVPAVEAQQIGLVNKTVPRNALDAEVDALCQRLLSLSPDGIRLTKRAIRTIKNTVLSEMTTHAEMNASAVTSTEMQHVFQSFLDK